MFILKILFAPLSLILSLFVWLCAGLLSCSGFVFKLASGLLSLLAFAVLITLFQKLKCSVKVFRHLRFMLLCKLRADRHQRIHKFHAVFPDTAARHPDAVSDLLFVAPTGCHQMKILLRAFRIDIRIAGVNLFCPLMVGAQRLGRATLMLGKS